MADEFGCFNLIRKKNRRRSGTAVLVFPGFLPLYSILSDEAKMLSEFGDVLAFHYPEHEINIDQFYNRVTESIQSLGYKKLILVGISFGGILAYLLMRKWRHQRRNLVVQCFIGLSTPFEPENLTFRSQMELDVEMSLDRYARRVFVEFVRVLRWLWRLSFGITPFYAKDNSFKQTLSALWMAGYTLDRKWFVKKRFTKLPALLLNVRRGVRDAFVLRTNVLDFKELFPRGVVMEVLKHHGDLHGLASSTKCQIRQWIEMAVEQ